MFDLVKSWMLALWIVLGLVDLANAELLLLTHKGDSVYYAIDAGTYPQESQDKKDQIRSIFNDILMVYQWPMISSHFYDLEPNDQHDYLQALGKDHGVTLFVQEKLDMLYGDTYRVYFVPTTIFELAAINSFMEYMINSAPMIAPEKVIIKSVEEMLKELEVLKLNSAEEFKKPKRVLLDEKEFYSTKEDKDSLIPENILKENKKIDFRNGDYIQTKFQNDFAGLIVDTLNKNRGEPHAAMMAMKTACDQFNKSDTTFELFLQATSYLVKMHRTATEFFKITKFFEISQHDLDRLIKTMISDNNKIDRDYEISLANKDKDLRDQKHKVSKHFRDEHTYFSDEDTEFLKKAVKLDCHAEQKNEFLLFRGTKGLEVGKSKIIDSPYRESTEDYEEALKDWPASLKKPFLPIQITERPEDKRNTFYQDKRNSFYPFSLSFGNSLLAGTFHEASLTGARALGYFHQGVGYVLVFPILNYINQLPSSGKLALSQKFMVSSLCPLVALFAKGEYFHSRSKVSFLHLTKKPANSFGGVTNKSIREGDIEKFDREMQSGFIVTPGVDWTTLHTGISYDIAEHSVWIKEPPSPKDWQEAQKNFALFSSMEVSAFKDHFLKFQPVLEQLKSKTKTIP